MPKIAAEHQIDFPTLPVDSIIGVKVETIDVVDIPGRNGRESWQKLEFVFRITRVDTTGDGSPVENYASLVGQKIWGSVPFRLTDSVENKLRQWTEALLGMEVAVGFELDTDYLLRREARAITSTWTKQATGKARHQVESLLRAGGLMGNPAQPAAQPTQGAAQQYAQSAAQGAIAQDDPWATPAAQPAQQPAFAVGGFPEDPPF